MEAYPIRAYRTSSDRPEGEKLGILSHYRSGKDGGNINESYGALESIKPGHWRNPMKNGLPNLLKSKKIRFGSEIFET